MKTAIRFSLLTPMRVIVLALCSLTVSLHAQHNPIFSGGNEDGAHVGRFSLPFNNSIFAGGTEDGATLRTYSQPFNSRIFWGGDDDGTGSGLFSAQTHNGIFEGGMDDGFSMHVHQMASNNSIFFGGNGDGFEANRFAHDSHNSIFSGGAGDGYDQKQVEGLPSSLDPTFAVELLKFDAWPEGNLVRVAWTTENEVDHDVFHVEKSKDAIISEVVTILPGQGGPGIRQHYEIEDPNPFPGRSYYRLRATDLNGGFEYSQWVEVTMPETYEVKVSIYPNPTADILNIQIEGALEGPVYLELRDLFGRKLPISISSLALPGSGSTAVSLAHLPAGIYLLTLQDEEGEWMQSHRIEVLK